jgi:hypothetical protein
LEADPCEDGGRALLDSRENEAIVFEALSCVRLQGDALGAAAVKGEAELNWRELTVGGAKADGLVCDADVYRRRTGVFEGRGESEVLSRLKDRRDLRNGELKVREE